MTPPVRVCVTAVTHPGIARPTNEDHIAIGEWRATGEMDRPVQIARELQDPLACLLADGMGGHASGEVASLVAVRGGQELLPSAEDETSLIDVVRQINVELFVEMQKSPSLRGMGTTLVGLVLRSRGHLYVNIGDSRLYRWKNGFLRQLTIDDAASAPLDGETGRRSGVLSQCLGGRSSITEIQPHSGQEPAVSGWRYLLCSDGLTDMVPLSQIEATIGEDDERTVQNLLASALTAGGEDNISIILVSLL